MRRLIIAEKPDVARAIGRVLGATSNAQGYLEGPNAIVSWAFGHLVEISEPEAMNPEWGGRWRMDNLPMIPERWLYSVQHSGRAQYAILKRLLNDPLVDEVINACDAGREGEHIFRLVYEQARASKPIRRLWVSALTDRGITEAFKALRPGRDYENLAAAAKARAHADWLVGLNATRGYSVLNGDTCTIGRVQTPTLALVVARQDEIDHFVPEPFYEVLAAFDPGGFRARRIDEHGKTRISDRSVADKILAEISPLPTGTVSKVSTTDVASHAPALPDLLELQKVASRRWGYSAARVLQIAQTLYERHKLITYPRTDCRHLSRDVEETLPEVVGALSGRYPRETTLAKAGLNRPLSKAYVDDTKLTDHHAIIPTDHRPDGIALEEDEQRLYDLIVRRFLCVFLPPQVRAETEVLLDVGAHVFRARGTVVKEPGWTAITGPEDAKAPKRDDEDERDEQRLPALREHQTCPKRAQELAARETQPPRPYTDGTLLDAMKKAGAKLDDKDLVALMRHAGLGTQATRAAIIERLLKSAYLMRRGKAIHPTPKGVEIIRQVHPDLSSPELTARWEQQLKAIEGGQGNATDFERRIGEHVRGILDHVRAATPLDASLTARPPGRARGGRSFSGRGRGGRTPRRGPRRSTSPMTTSEARTMSPAAAQGTTLGCCPRCGKGEIRVTDRAYGCSRWREGCDFTIWRTIAGKPIPPDVAQEVIVRGRSHTLSGFKSRAGKPFSAALVRTPKGVQFEFADRRR